MRMQNRAWGFQFTESEVQLTATLAMFLGLAIIVIGCLVLIGLWQLSS